jgi:hypothetical protein
MSINADAANYIGNYIDVILPLLDKSQDNCKLYRKLICGNSGAEGIMLTEDFYCDEVLSGLFVI